MSWLDERPTKHPESPLDLLWRAPAILRVVVAGELLAGVIVLAPLELPQRLVHFGILSLAIQWIAMLALLLLYLARRRLVHLPLHHLAWIGVLAMLLAGILLGGLAWWLLPVEPADWLQAGLRLLLVIALVGFSAALVFQKLWENRQLALRTKQLELETLHARIRPHFLFNTLNTGAALVHARPNEAERVLLDLADLFRTALRGPQRIPLADELDLTRRYLDIEALRFGERLQLDWDVPEPVPVVAVPSLSIQPLAENAIRHGIERRARGGRIEVAVREAPDHVEILVRNDLPEDAATVHGHAVGLASARERVDALTGGLGEVRAGVEDGRYVVRMRVPSG